MMDEQLCMLGFGVSLPEKIDKAIANLREYEKEALRRDPVNGYYLCDSFGKDSGVILRLAQMAGVRFVAHHNLTTLDPPELIWHGKKWHPETVIHKPSISMLHMLATTANVMPTRIIRWCCATYKEGRDGEGKERQKGLVKIFGVRAAESARRKANWKIWTPHRKDGWILNPILYWTDDDVWRFTRNNSVSYCKLYDEGRKRLGCIGCPMSSKRNEDFKRWPKYLQGWQRACRRYWERCKDRELHDGRTVKDKWPTWEHHWRWWMEELPESDEDDCQMGLF